jgi:hypothetical protein
MDKNNENTLNNNNISNHINNKTSSISEFNMDSTSKNSMSSNILNKVYSFLFDLPFQNYHEYYKTGKIQKMSREEKIQFLIENNKKRQHYDFFRRLLLIRPTFLDDEDYYEYNEKLNKIKKLRGVAIIAFAGNWSYFVFNFIVKRRSVVKSFLLFNFVTLIYYVSLNASMNKETTRLFEKYKDLMKRDELDKLIKESYRID